MLATIAARRAEARRLRSRGHRVVRATEFAAMHRTKVVMLAGAFSFASTACHTEPPRGDGGEQLRQLLELVEREYVRDVPADRLAAVARDAMLASLDPYATYFDPAAYAEWNVAVAGSFGG